MSLLAQTHSPAFVDDLQSSQKRVLNVLDDLKRISGTTADRIQELVKQLDSRTRDFDAMAAAAVANLDQSPAKTDLQRADQVKRSWREASKQQGELLSEVERVANEQLKDGNQSRFTSWYSFLNGKIVFVIGAAWCSSWLLSFALSQSIINRIKTLQQNASQVETKQSSQLSRSAGDEIARLSRLFNDLDARLIDVVKREQAAITYANDARLRLESERNQFDTQSESSRAQTRMLMDQMPAGLLLLSENGYIQLANAHAVQMTDRAAESLIGSPFTSLLSDKTFASPAAFIELLCQRSQLYFSTIDKGAEGEVRVQLGISRVWRENGQDFYLLIMLDCTDRDQFEELRQRLIAMIAHDIATPLATVHNTLQMAITGMLGELEPSLRMKVDEAARKSSRIVQTFRNVVRFQKLAAGFSSLSASQLLLDDLTLQALQVVRPEVEERDLRIVNNVGEEIAAIGDADKLALLGSRLLQVVVESCNDETSISIDGFKEQTFVNWCLKIENDCKILQRLQPYLVDADVFELDSDTVENNLDLVLWRLLLYQTGARVAQAATENGCTIILRLPLPESTSIAPTVA